MSEPIGRTRLQPDTEERFLSLRRELGLTSLGLNQITLAPGQRMRIHRHAHQEEVYLVVEGELTILIEQEETRLGTGELLRLAPEIRRQLVNRGPERVVILALGAAGEHQSRDAEAFHRWEDADGASPQEVPLPEDLPVSERGG
jgi:uncharacterized cupin superfamily protein